MNSARSILIVLLIASLMLLLSASGAVASWAEYYHSVHFNSGEPDFGTVPRRAYPTRGGGTGGLVEDKYLNRCELSEERDEALQERHNRQKNALQIRFRAALDTGKWGEGRRLLLLQGREVGWIGGLRDRVEALSAAGQVSNSTLRVYLKAMDDLEGEPDHWNRAQATFASLRRDSTAGPLREHAAYQLASLAYAWFDFPRAVGLYQQFLEDFPKSGKREAGLIMMARCGILPATPQGRRLAEAQQALDTLRRDFPHSRFSRSAAGLRARLDFLDDRFVKAADAYLALGDMASVEMCAKQMSRTEKDAIRPRILAGHLRLIERTDNYAAYSRSVADVDHSMQALSPSGARAFVQMLLHDPTLAAPYFYYRLYHCNNESKDLTNLVHLADRIGSRVRLSPEICVRLAEVHYQSRKYREALRWAGRAERSTNESYDRLLYVRGATLHKLRRFSEARSAFQQLLAQCPESELQRGAREEMAILLEQQGDLAGALEQYFALHYDNDIAFLLDCKMTPEQIAVMLQNHPRHPRRDLIVYSLGMRYLRLERWDDARRCLRAIPHNEYKRFCAVFDRWAAPPTESTRQDPLRTIDICVRLQNAIRRAKNRTDRASAIYRYGRFYYHSDELLLYNAALWNYGRMASFDMYWNKAINTSLDKAATRRHTYEHEAYAHALKLFERVTQEYPDTPTAPYALYSAACAAERLSDFNEWWRDEDAQHGLSRRASDHMAELARRYPKHPLAGHARKYARVFRAEYSDNLKLWKETRAEEAKREADALLGRDDTL